ncbi:DUF4190 domain-containing protein [Actinomadura rudentiformis]|uniref:DUF4190 domain-containing protein n=2 Tax=Actinomadura rudentiformis TaxID=359158 RepID=A0A6H9Z1P4_9ACTN|nr:DUF4190 domain-containing protein [Actinomadura rudentiformis]
MTYPPGSGFPGNDPAPGAAPQPMYPAPGDPPLPGPASHRPSSDSTNGLAIASLITGLLGCFGILGLILGAIAMKQIKERGQKGRGLAIGGIVLSLLWVVGGTAGYLFISSLDKDDLDKLATPKVTTTKPKDVRANKMRVGDCINDNSGATTSIEGPVEVESVKVVPCTTPHDGEVLATFRLSTATLPSESQMSTLAGKGCQQRIGSRLSREPARRSLATSYYFPSVQSWASGDRAITCVAVHAKDGTKLTRKLRT